MAVSTHPAGAEQSRRVRAYAPASIGNFAAGFDLLGAALAPLDGSLLGDVVDLRGADQDSFQVLGAAAADLAGDGRLNLVLAARDLYRERLLERGASCGPVAISLEKNLPVNSGLGSSASSIVATLVGLQALCGSPLATEELLTLAGQAEALYGGAPHWDNVAPSLLGGMRLQVPGQAEASATRSLPWPEDLVLVVVHPEFQLGTARSRAALPGQWPLAPVLGFAENLAGFVHALHTRDRGLLARCLRDPLAEPYRADLVPGFPAVQAAALAAGALGCSLSGSGPAVFAVAPSVALAGGIAEGIRDAFQGAGLATRGWLCALDPQGARLLS